MNKRILGCYDGRLYVMRATDGAQVNYFQTGSEIKSSPSVDLGSGHIWFGSHDGYLRCVSIRPNQETCALLGELQCKGSIFASCAIASEAR
jgi:outer membrane protein assembly factor BamB